MPYTPDPRYAPDPRYTRVDPRYAPDPRYRTGPPYGSSNVDPTDLRSRIQKDALDVAWSTMNERAEKIRIVEAARRADEAKRDKTKSDRG